MLIIKNNKIDVTRGDTGKITITLTKSNGDQYEIGENDVLTMTVRSAIGMPIIFEKKVIGSNVISLAQADTKRLPVGVCVFDIQLDTEEHDTFTVVGPKSVTEKNMTVYPEVTE